MLRVPVSAAATDRTALPFPLVKARVEHIHLAPNHGAPVVSVPEVVAVEQQGLEGDRNLGSVRNVTIVCDGELAKAAAELGLETIPPGATRRNITVSLDRLPRTHGTRMTLGEATLEVWRDCAPCEVMDESVAPGARSALKDRAGIGATVIRGGVIRVGDEVTIDS